MTGKQISNEELARLLEAIQLHCAVTAQMLSVVLGVINDRDPETAAAIKAGFREKAADIDDPDVSSQLLSLAENLGTKDPPSLSVIPGGKDER